MRVSLQSGAAASACVRLGHEPQLGPAPNECGRADVLAARLLQVIQVLLQRPLIKLGEEVRLRGAVVAPNVIDELTFIHGGFTVEIAATGDAPRACSFTTPAPRAAPPPRHSCD